MRKGYTLVELLTVMTIIGLLTTLGFYGYAISLQRNRDAKRLSDMQTIKNALEQYYTDHRSYPTFASSTTPIYDAKWQLYEDTTGCTYSGAARSSTLKRYLTTFPEDPQHPAGFSTTCIKKDNSAYAYDIKPVATPPSSIANPTGYYLMAKMEREINKKTLPTTGSTSLSSKHAATHNYYLENDK